MGMAQVVENLPSKYKSLISNPSIGKTNKQTKTKTKTLQNYLAILQLD
jgi:hypothetical protein